MILFRKLENTIVGTVNGKPFNVTRTPETETEIQTFADSGADETAVLDYCKAQRNKAIAGSNEYLVFNPMTKEYFLKVEKFTSKHPIPGNLVKYIEESYDKGIDFMPILKAWARLLANPRYNSEMGKFFDLYLGTTYVDKEMAKQLVLDEGYTVEAAEALSTYPDISITQEGLLATYKVAEIVTWEYKMEWNEDTEAFEKVKKLKYEQIAPELDPVTGEILKAASYVKPKFKEDFVFTPAIHKNGDKFYSDNVLGYVYQVGKIQRLPANAVRNLNNTFGGGGLYSGGLKYIENYKGEGSHILTCFVNPGDILSFQSEGHAFRTDALFPNNVWDEDVALKSIYHSSDYDKLSSERLEDIIKNAKDASKFRDEQEEVNERRLNGEELKADE